MDAIRMHQQVWRQQVELCRHHRCTHVVVLGDTFDTPHPTEDEKAMVMRELHEMRDLRTIVVMGNHDVLDAATNSLTLLRQMPEVGALRHVTFAMTTCMVNFDGWKILAVPWGRRVPQCRPDLVVFHDSIAGARMDNGHPCAKGIVGIRELGVPAAGGHLHTPQRTGDVVFCGTATQLSFGEMRREGEKRFWHITLRPGREHAWHSEPIVDPIWMLRKVRFSTEDPPACDDPNTFYSVDASGDRPGPRWRQDHPRVISTHGSRSDRMLKVASKVVTLMQGKTDQVGTLSDQDLMRRWLKQHSTLDGLGLTMAMKIHDKLSLGTEH